MPNIDYFDRQAISNLQERLREITDRLDEIDSFLKKLPEYWATPPVTGDDWSHMEEGLDV
jgi:hypothetical protein